MTIRPATTADAETIAAMLSRLAAEIGDAARFASSAETIRAHGFGATPLFETLIADRQGSADGLALFLRHFSTTRGQPGVYVQDLWVAPAARGRGLGAQLLGAVAGYARERWGAAYLALTRHDHNAAAASFYTRLGFTTHRDEVPMRLTGSGFACLAAAAGPGAAP